MQIETMSVPTPSSAISREDFRDVSSTPPRGSRTTIAAPPRM
ncbi:hypothetical protein ACIF83_12035 [Streptomyces sp. NPDC085866]